MLHIYSLVTMPSTQEGDDTDIVFQPPVAYNGNIITKMAFARYGNQRIGIRLLAIDDELGGAETPYATLSRNVPELKLSSPSHFFVLDDGDFEYSALADAIAATGHIEKVVTGKPCPFCKTVYAPKYKTLEEAKTIEPGSIFVEQHMSGCCSDKCWDAAFKPDDY